MSNQVSEILEKLPAWERAFSEDGQIDEDSRLTIREAFSSPDAPILFPKVISRALKEAAEPVQLVTPLLSTVRLGKARSFEFPAVNAIQASVIPEGQEYPEQQLAFVKQAEGKVSKKGVKVAFTEEVIADSMWDIVGLHVRAAGRAMARLKEQIALGVFGDAASIVFDNDDAGVPNTTGLGIDGVANNTYTWDDVIDQAAVLMGENKNATDFIVHPLAWALFLKDAVFHAGGSQYGGAWNGNLSSQAGSVNASAPLGINVIVSPFVNFTPKDGDTPAKSDIFLIDRSEVGVLMVREDLSTDDWNDPTRDISLMKMKERYDIVALGDGEGITVAKNVSIARNYDVQVVNQVTL